ncbi:hypothetical protein B0T25DRAFT_29721 [Lasiosphaeria hispida]|uniref:Uncharacterized protein n=1 Tax=Lasiosphaeria hispida TaxID=260671 RepID=A0AAJ0HUQ4_9PEZI|nr:hypothetical protein B0T25DRAFT_29721 [Lasiosphaeria hispida]
MGVGRVGSFCLWNTMSRGADARHDEGQMRRPFRRSRGRVHLQDFREPPPECHLLVVHSQKAIHWTLVKGGSRKVVGEETLPSCPCLRPIVSHGDIQKPPICPARSVCTPESSRLARREPAFFLSLLWVPESNEYWTAPSSLLRRSGLVVVVGVELESGPKTTDTLFYLHRLPCRSFDAFFF